MKQGEIWDISLEGSHETETGEKCSVIIINDNIISVLPSRVIVPLKIWQEKFTEAVWLIRVDPNDENNLNQTIAVDAFQMYTIPITRFIKKIGTVSAQELQQIKML